MKLVLELLTSLALATSVYSSDDKKESPGKGEMKTVCHPKKDKDGKEVKGKDGKVVEECKEIKVRKKLEGHEIPTKDKK